MDLLFKRYASPYLILEDMVRMGQLATFVSKVRMKANEDLQWEYWLHKVFDKGFEDYKKECIQNNKKNFIMNDKEVKATIEKSKGILKGFKMR